MSEAIDESELEVKTAKLDSILSDKIGIIEDWKRYFCANNPDAAYANLLETQKDFSVWQVFESLRDCKAAPQSERK